MKRMKMLKCSTLPRHWYEHPTVVLFCFVAIINLEYLIKPTVVYAIANAMLPGSKTFVTV